MYCQLELSGVGGRTSGDLYKVNFDFGNIHFKDLPVIHKEIKVADAYMILPATLFEDMIYEINNIEHTFKVSVDSKSCYRQFKVKDNNGIPYVYLAHTYASEEEYYSYITS